MFHLLQLLMHLWERIDQAVEKGSSATSRPESLSPVRCDTPVLRSTETRLMLLARRIGPSRSSQAGGYNSRARPSVIVSRSERSRSNVLLKYASARRFLARLASETFLTALKTEFFKTL